MSSNDLLTREQEAVIATFLAMKCNITIMLANPRLRLLVFQYIDRYYGNPVLPQNQQKSDAAPMPYLTKAQMADAAELARSFPGFDEAAFSGCMAVAPNGTD